jgi:uncharacterized protein (TIGR03435 family)
MVLTSYAFGQSAFEVASIKPNVSGSGHSSTNTSKGGVTMRNVSLKQCIEMAYDVKDYALSGPDWLGSEKFDIVAKPPSDTPEDQFGPMLQSLLADRFKMTVHRESKTLSAYALVVGKNGPQLQKAEAGEGSHMNNDGNNGKSKLTGQRVSMPRLADFLSRQLDRPVIDMTELPGVFDLKLEWADERQATAEGPSLFTALQEQLGLKLEARKLPVEILVVDHVAKVPTEN